MEKKGEGGIGGRARDGVVRGMRNGQLVKRFGGQKMIRLEEAGDCESVLLFFDHSMF